ncbi:type IV pilus secretin (or competence protein) PilQ [Variovorax sp. YR752]|nr:type IV pilus secretin (or competence protein) PilQ [Variovorax sp. YR752]
MDGSARLLQRACAHAGEAVVKCRLAGASYVKVPSIRRSRMAMRAPLLAFRARSGWVAVLKAAMAVTNESMITQGYDAGASGELRHGPCSFLVRKRGLEFHASMPGAAQAPKRRMTPTSLEECGRSLGSRQDQLHQKATALARRCRDASVVHLHRATSNGQTEAHAVHLRTNQLFVSDIPSRLQQVAELIQKLDVPVRQVPIEARIVEASDTFSKSLGVKLGGSSKGSNSSIGTQATTSSDGTVSYSSTSSSNFVNLPASSSSGTSTGTFAVSLYNSSMSKILNLEISALEEDGKGKVVASPRVVTADQTKALIEQGTELPYQSATSSGATSVSFRKANLRLEVTPQITPEGNIILTLDVNKDCVGQSTTAGYAINTKHVQTEVLVENGGTVVIGGIFELSETNDESRIPVLGELPYVGVLFRSRTREVKKSELLIFITPKMITDRNAAR